MEDDQVPTGPRALPERAPAARSDQRPMRGTAAADAGRLPGVRAALPRPGPCPNWWCRRADRGFSVVFAVGVHAGALRHAVLRYKYGREMWWAEVFARLFADHLPLPCHLVRGVRSAGPDAGVCRVPDARRDWDPVGEIVARLGGLVAPLWENGVGRVAKRAETPAMQGRSRGRTASGSPSGPLRRSLVVPAPTRVAGARILVLDDVLTEGGRCGRWPTCCAGRGRRRWPGWCWPGRSGRGRVPRVRPAEPDRPRPARGCGFWWPSSVSFDSRGSAVGPLREAEP